MKALWIATVKVTAPERYVQYQELAPAALKKYNARLITRSDESIALESRDNVRPERCVVFEFESMQQALDCYESEEYKKARAARQNAAIVDIQLVPSP